MPVEALASTARSSFEIRMARTPHAMAFDLPPSCVPIIN